MSATGVSRLAVPGAIAIALLLGPAIHAGAQPSFTPGVNVSATPGFASDRPAIAIADGTTYVAWRQATDGGHQLRLRRSSNGGTSFGDAPSGRTVALLDPADRVHSLAVAANGTTVLVLYTAGASPEIARPWLAVSTNGGTSFAAPRQLLDPPDGAGARADLAIDGSGNIHVVVEDRAVTGDVVYLRSTDGAATFEAPRVLSASAAPSIAPGVDANGSTVVVWWQDTIGATGGSPGAGDIMLARSADGGVTFDAATALTTTPAHSTDAALAIGTALHAVWVEGNALVHSASADGVTFTAATLLAAAPSGGALTPALAVSGATVHVTWTTTAGDGSIDGPFYRRSADGGLTFAAQQDLRFGEPGAATGAPAIASAPRARVVWPHSAIGVESDSDVLLVAEASCVVSWAAAVSGNWTDASKWSPAVVPGDWADVCITVPGTYSVTIPGAARAASLVVGDADNAENPTAILTGTLTFTNTIVNSGVLSFRNGSQLASTNGIALNTRGGLATNPAGHPFVLNSHFTNQGGNVEFGANVSLTGVHTFTNAGTMRVSAGATVQMNTNFSFVQESGLLDVDGSFVNGVSAIVYFNGGDIDGALTFMGVGWLAIGPNSRGTGTFVFRLGNNAGSARLSGNIAPAQTVKILTCCNSAAGNVTVAAQSSFTNEGTLILDSEPTATGQIAALSMPDGARLLNLGTIVIGNTVPASTKQFIGSVENHGTVDILDTVSFGGTSRFFTNHGSLYIAPGAQMVTGASFVFNQNAGTVRVDGKLELSGEFSTAGDSFNYNGGTVLGTVIIQGHSHLRIGPGSSGPGTFQFERNVIFGISNYATIEGSIAPAQTIRLLGTAGGTSEVRAPAGFTNEGTIEIDGTVASSGGASFWIAGGPLVNFGRIRVGPTGIGKGIYGSIENRGTFDVQNNLGLPAANATFTNLAAFTVAAGKKVTLGPAAVVNQNAGVMMLDGPIELATEASTAPDLFNFNGGELVGSRGVELTSTSRLNIGAGAADGPGLFTFRVQGQSAGGTLSGNVGQRHTVKIAGTAVTSAAGFTNAGTVNILAEVSGQAAQLSVTNGVLVNDGLITLDNVATTAPLNFVLDNRGRVVVRDTIQLSRPSVTHVNTGVFEIAAGQTVTLAGLATFRNLPPGSVEGGGTLSIVSGSVLDGVGALGVNVVNAGRIRPGASPGAFDISGNFTQTSTGRLEIEIQGPVPGTGYDRVNVGGLATLGGALDVVVAPGFCVEGTYTPLTYGSVGTSDFATRTGLTGLAGGRSLVASKQPSAYTLAAVGATCNTPPAGVADAYSVDEDAVLAILAPGVLANDSDAQGDPLTAMLVAGPSHGTLSLDANGSFTYVPAADYHGPDAFSYAPRDAVSAGNTVTVSITVRPVNDAPELAPVANVAVDAGTTVAFTLQASDADGDVLAFSALGLPAGAALDAATGAFVWTPLHAQAGVYPITFVATDAGGLFSQQTATITVTTTNQAPQCATAQPSVAEIWPPDGRSVPVSVLGVTDPDGDPVSIAFTQMLQNGAPATDASGTGSSQATVKAVRPGHEKDGRTYQLFFEASDGAGGTCTGSVVVTVPHDRGRRGR